MDITFCKGEGCPIKEKCRRFKENTKVSEMQSWFVSTPGEYCESTQTFSNPRDSTRTNIWKCDMYWGDTQDSILHTLKNIMR